MRIAEVSSQEESEYSQQQLSQSQGEALAVILSGKNVFLTGEAGSGKSYLIKYLQQLMEEQGKSLVITATTGQAAWNISGITLHKFMAMGLATQDVDTLMQQVSKNKAAVAKFRRTNLLLIDEVSMLEEEFANKCDQVLRQCLGVARPFGGIQLILVGDFFQLPPVNKGKHNCGALFDSQLWEQLDLTVCNLTSNFRQQKDDEYKSFLNRLRVGKLHDADTHLIESRTFLDHESFEEHTFLLALRKEVEAINSIHLSKLALPERVFLAMTSSCSKESSSKQSRYPVDKEVRLRVGAKVILCCNLDLTRGLYNGTSGIVVDFQASKSNNHHSPVVEFDNGVRETIFPNTWKMMEGNRLVDTFTQIPLILMYACTIHRVQGLTLKKIKVSTRVFAYGQLYVACSRVGSKEDIVFIDNINVRTTPLCDSAVYKYYKANALVFQ
jgi:ATP-dependent DNA helicase PIF1